MHCAGQHLFCWPSGAHDGRAHLIPCRELLRRQVDTADLWMKLMQNVLGYKKFAAEGGDWGAIVTAQLGHKYADRLIGIHMHLLVSLGFFTGGGHWSRM